MSFKPPKEVAERAKRGLELRKEFGRGGTQVGLIRANQLAKRENVSLDTIKRMKAFFDRHQKNRGDGRENPPSNGWIAWELWGGDEGWAWAKEILRKEKIVGALNSLLTSKT